MKNLKEKIDEMIGNLEVSLPEIDSSINWGKYLTSLKSIKEALSKEVYITPFRLAIYTSRVNSIEKSILDELSQDNQVDSNFVPSTSGARV